MENKFFEIASHVSSPLALAGLVVGALFLIFKKILSMNIFPQLTRQLGGAILLKIINTFLVLALVAIILGFAGYAMQTYYPKLEHDFVSMGSDEDQSLEHVVQALAKGRNVTINFGQNCDQARSATVEAGEYEGKNIVEFLENLKQRVKGNSVNYLAKKEGEQRYEIICH